MNPRIEYQYLNLKGLNTFDFRTIFPRHGRNPQRYQHVGLKNMHQVQRTTAE